MTTTINDRRATPRLNVEHKAGIAFEVSARVTLTKAMPGRPGLVAMATVTPSGAWASSAGWASSSTAPHTRWPDQRPDFSATVRRRARRWCRRPARGRRARRAHPLCHLSQPRGCAGHALSCRGRAPERDERRWGALACRCAGPGHRDGHRQRLVRRLRRARLRQVGSVRLDVRARRLDALLIAPG